MITNAVVVEINGKTATVEAARKSACDGCHKQTDGKSCAVCSLLGSDKKIRTSAKNALGATVGDRVEVEASTVKMLVYAVLIFLLPIAATVAAYFIAGRAGLSEGVSLGVAGGAFLAVIIADIFISKAVGRRQPDLTIVKIIKEK